MGIDWNLFEQVAFRDGNTERDRMIAEQKYFVNKMMVDAPYCDECEIDGKIYRMAILDTSVSTCKKFYTLPQDEGIIGYGDIIKWRDSYWIVTDLDAHNEINNYGKIEQCNYLFRFQTGNSAINERWGSIDTGAYSTTLLDTKTATVPNYQYRIYLPYDDKTKMLYLGKRLAIDKWYDSEGNEILLCYRITAIDSVSKSLGDSKLLVLKCESDQYDTKADNLEEMICDYIPLGTSSSPANNGGGWV